MLIVKKNGTIYALAKNDPIYKPDYESEKNKPATLFVNTKKDKKGLSND